MDTVLNGKWVSVVLQALRFLCGVHGSHGQRTLNGSIQQLQPNRACTLPVLKKYQRPPTA